MVQQLRALSMQSRELEFRSQDQHYKSGVCHMPVLIALVGQRQNDCWDLPSCSLAENMSSRFKERTCLKKIGENDKGGQ